eukprot:TRINITY_DN7570_c0_g2_i1.p1 TRINITY_DN7570_c0_g2~~TRINITY_DN7570_c0_g2_i1.p1  ORF type:complete len:742 (-),score=228.85 TRINITY_DN7570_c0_g2_i1:77-2302(-)
MADPGHHNTNDGSNTGRSRSKSSEKNFLKNLGSGSPLVGRSSPTMASQISRHASQPHDWNNPRNRSASYPDNSPPNSSHLERRSPKQGVVHSKTLTSEEIARNKFATMNTMSGSASTSSIPAALRTSYGNLLASNPSSSNIERRNSDTVNNYSFEKKTGCTLSSSRLDFINVPVRLLDDNSYPDTQVITIINNSKEKYFFKVERDPPSARKYDLNITPSSGKLGKLDRKNGKNQIQISISLRAFCTTRSSERISIVLIPRERTTLFRRPSNLNLEKEIAAKSAATSSENKFYVKISIESELSTSIDCDEVEFLGEISSGGWGSVHRAKWREIEIAVKKLHIQELTVEQKEEVLREQNLLKKLACPYVVTYIGSTQVPGQPICLLMEYCKEGSLSKLLKSKRISDRLKVKILLDIAKGMNFLHYNHFYHRDLKPDNVLVVSPHENASISVKITDFDTARYYYTKTARPGAETYETFNYNNLMSTSSSNLKEVNNVKSKVTIDSSPPERGLSKGLGTLEYKPPEVIRGEEDYPVDKSDSYSFGMLAWQVWVQRVPYADPPYKEMSPREIEEFVASGKRIECPDNMRLEIKKLILECWDQNPHNRPDFRRITDELQSVWEEMINPRDEDKDGSSVTSLDGWAGDISREEAEQLLLHSQSGTFLIRRSFNVKGYVLSYKSENAILHIRDILPEDGKIKVIKEDHRVLKFDSLKDYINSMKKQKVISHALDMRTYTKTPLEDALLS